MGIAALAYDRKIPRRPKAVPQPFAPLEALRSRLARLLSFRPIACFLKDCHNYRRFSNERHR